MAEPRLPHDETDETDERIRALLGRVVASAPPPPSTDELRRSDLPAVSLVLTSSASASGTGDGRRARDGRRPPRSGTGRLLRAVAASVAVVALAVTGARAIGDRDAARDADDRVASTGDGLPVRYVPTDLPTGLELTAVELSAEPAPNPTPEITVYDGPGGLQVRIAEGPTDWAARSAGPTLNSPSSSTPPGTEAPVTTEAPTTTAPATTVPSTTPPDTTDTTGPTVPTSPGTTAGPAGPTDTAGPTTTVPGLDAASLPSVPGVPGRPDIRATTVRGDVGGLEAHDAKATTVWFLDRGQLAAVDVFGVDEVAALGLVERLTVGADGRLEPAPEDRLRRVAAAPARPAGAPPPATAQLVYTVPDRQGDGRDDDGGVGGPAFVVTTSRLAPDADDLLSATVGSFGRIEQWGDHEVLVDDGLDNGHTTLVSFVDREAGVLVTVLGSTGDLRTYFEAVFPVDERQWDRVVAGLDESADPAGEPTTEPR